MAIVFAVVGLIVLCCAVLMGSRAIRALKAIFSKDRKERAAVLGEMKAFAIFLAVVAAFLALAYFLLHT